MKLDRNSNSDHHGKYALLKVRRLNEFRSDGPFGEIAPNIAAALKVLEDAGALEWGDNGTESEFFVIKLRDQFAAEGLEAYANEAGRFDPEYADEVRTLADRAGPNSPFCKRPD